MTIRPIYYDTETTGVKSEKDYIIEIAAYDPISGDTFEKLINPGSPIPAEASAIHNITDDMVKDAPPFSEIGKEFIEFCKGDSILIAHNNDGFDIHFLRAEFSRNGLDMPNWRFLDTLKWARRYRPDLPKHSLQFLREIYNIPANNAHRALDDVIVLYRVFEQMIDDLDINEVYTLMNQKKKLRHMPFGKHQGEPINRVPKSYVKWLAQSGALDKEENTHLRETFAELGLLSV